MSMCVCSSVSMSYKSFSLKLAFCVLQYHGKYIHMYIHAWIYSKYTYMYIVYSIYHYTVPISHQYV